MQLQQALKSYWDRLTGKFSGDQSLRDRYFVEILSKYTAKSRHYHNGVHLQSLLQLSDDYHERLADKEVVDFSIFYHDIVYNVLRNDNEPRSAQMAVKHLQALHVPGEKVQQVKVFIEATKTHLVPGDVQHRTDLALFLDFDMSILGAHWDDYLVYTQQIRKEYRIFPAKLYNPGRKKFLQQCLQATFIFHSPEFRAHFERQARLNIERELAIMTDPKN